MNLKIGSRIYDEQTKSFGKVAFINKDSFIVEWADCKTKHPVTTILKEASVDCPDCHGNFVGKENEKCPTCGRFSVKEATVEPFCPKCDALGNRVRVEKYVDGYECTKGHKLTNEELHKESLKTALPPVLPNQRGYLDNPSPVEKKAEVVDSEELELYTENERDLHDNFMDIVNLAKVELRDNKYDQKEFLSFWVDWYTKGAQKYQREFKGSTISPNAIQEAAARQEPFIKEQVLNGEYGATKAPVQQGLDINKLPVMDVEQEKDKLIDQLAIETDPEKKKSLERRYKHLTMASLNKVAHIRHENGKWVIYSHDYKKKLGEYSSESAAKKRLQQIEMFKHMKSSKVRPFSKKAVETMIDPYQALTQQISDMRTRMEQVQQRLESNPLPKQAGKDETDPSELSIEEVFEDVAMGLDLLESKLKDEPESEELHNSLEELENLLWETEQKTSIKPKISEEEKEEPEHKESIKEVVKEVLKEIEDKKEEPKEEEIIEINAAVTQITTTFSPVAPAANATPAVTPDDKKTSCALCGGMTFSDFTAYQQHMEYTHAGDTMPTIPAQKTLPTTAAVQVTDETIQEGTGTPPALPAVTPAPVIKNVQPTDFTEEDPTQMPTSPLPVGQKWIFNVNTRKYEVMTDPTVLGKTI